MTTMELKTCNRCDTDRPLNRFQPDVRYKGGYRHQCTDCRSEMALVGYHKDPEKFVSIARKSQLKQQYGLTPDDYQELFDLQNGLCAICSKPEPSGRRLAVDHDHENGLVRGLLCTNCNVALGHFKDSIECLERAIVYLGSQ